MRFRILLRIGPLGLQMNCKLASLACVRAWCLLCRLMLLSCNDNELDACVRRPRVRCAAGPREKGDGRVEAWMHLLQRKERLALRHGTAPLLRMCLLALQKGFVDRQKGRRVYAKGRERVALAPAVTCLCV